MERRELAGDTECPSDLVTSHLRARIMAGGLFCRDTSTGAVLHPGGRVLQALTYAPSGAIVAAPTTSLPEAIGGSRNWDYRFCWVRDACLTLEALWVAACPDEAKDYFDFFVTASGGLASGSGGMQVLYGVGGERALHEHELAHLDGYRGSRPVRVGNGAWDQVQLDIYGELLAAADLLAEQVGEFDAPTSAFLVDLAETAARRWQESDHGIWELCGGSRATSFTPRSCAGQPSTARSAWRRACGQSGTPSAGGRYGTRSGRPSWSGRGAREPGPSPRPLGATSWTRR